MTQIELIKRQLREADGVADVLAAGWEIFELIGVLAADGAEQTADLYPAFVFARGAAVGGRNAIALAPSMPSGDPASFGSPELSASDVNEIADTVAGLASALSGHLREVARLAADDGDRIACEDAARDADRISELLARGM